MIGLSTWMIVAYLRDRWSGRESCACTLHHGRILVRYWQARQAGQDDEHARATSDYAESISLLGEYTEASQGDDRRTRAEEELSRLWNLPIPEQIKTSTENRT